MLNGAAPRRFGICMHLNFIGLDDCGTINHFSLGDCFRTAILIILRTAGGCGDFGGLYGEGFRAVELY